jgi:hypothetical protein
MDFRSRSRAPLPAEKPQIDDVSEQLVKVHFDLDSSDWHGHGGESLWAAPIAGTEWSNFRIMNSPFFVRGVSFQDMVKAKPYEASLVFEFEAVVERGGHSTYMLIMEAGKPRVDAYWNMLEKMGCSYESSQIDLSIGRRRLYSVDVPPSADIYEVYEMLERGANDKVWMFQEGYAHLPKASQRPRSVR